MVTIQEAQSNIQEARGQIEQQKEQVAQAERQAQEQISQARKDLPEIQSKQALRSKFIGLIGREKRRQISQASKQISSEEKRIASEVSQAKEQIKSQELQVSDYEKQVKEAEKQIAEQANQVKIGGQTFSRDVYEAAENAMNRALQGKRYVFANRAEFEAFQAIKSTNPEYYQAGIEAGAEYRMSLKEPTTKQLEAYKVRSNLLKEIRLGNVPNVSIEGTTIKSLGKPIELSKVQIPEEVYNRITSVTTIGKEIKLPEVETSDLKRQLVSGENISVISPAPRVVISSNEEIKKLTGKEGIFGGAYGGGTIYLNPEEVTSKTMAHEYGHYKYDDTFLGNLTAEQQAKISKEGERALRLKYFDFFGKPASYEEGEYTKEAFAIASEKLWGGSRVSDFWVKTTMPETYKIISENKTLGNGKSTGVEVANVLGNLGVAGESRINIINDKRLLEVNIPTGTIINQQTGIGKTYVEVKESPESFSSFIEIKPLKKYAESFLETKYISPYSTTTMPINEVQVNKEVQKISANIEALNLKSLQFIQEDLKKKYIERRAGYQEYLAYGLIPKSVGEIAIMGGTALALGGLSKLAPTLVEAGTTAYGAYSTKMYLSAKTPQEKAAAAVGTLGLLSTVALGTKASKLLKEPPPVLVDLNAVKTKSNIPKVTNVMSPEAKTMINFNEDTIFTRAFEGRGNIEVSKYGYTYVQERSPISKLLGTLLNKPELIYPRVGSTKVGISKLGGDLFFYDKASAKVNRAKIGESLAKNIAQMENIPIEQARIKASRMTKTSLPYYSNIELRYGGNIRKINDNPIEVFLEGTSTETPKVVDAPSTKFGEFELISETRGGRAKIKNIKQYEKLSSSTEVGGKETNIFKGWMEEKYKGKTKSYLTKTETEKLLEIIKPEESSAMKLKQQQSETSSSTEPSISIYKNQEQIYLRDLSKEARRITSGRKVIQQDKLFDVTFKGSKSEIFAEPKGISKPESRVGVLDIGVKKQVTISEPMGTKTIEIFGTNQVGEPTTNIIVEELGYSISKDKNPFSNVKPSGRKSSKQFLEELYGEKEPIVKVEPPSIKQQESIVASATEGITKNLALSERGLPKIVGGKGEMVSEYAFGGIKFVKPNIIEESTIITAEVKVGSLSKSIIGGITGNTIKTNEMNILKVNELEDLQIKQNIKQDNLLKTISNVQLKESNILKENVILKENIMLKENIQLKENMMLKQNLKLNQKMQLKEQLKMMQKMIQKIPLETKTPPPSKPVEIIIPKGRNISKEKKSSAKETLSQMFEVYKRSKEGSSEFIKVGEEETLFKAGKKLKEILKGGLEATGEIKVKQTGRKVRFSEIANILGGEFRQSKGSPFLVVQRAERRLATRPEVIKIKVAKKNRRNTNWLS